jgi:glyoxylate/hydroxypyruvate reductase
MLTAIRKLGLATNFKASIPYKPILNSTFRSPSLSRPFHSNMPPRVVVTRRLPPTAQAALEKLDADIYQWQEDCTMPRETLLKEVKGT